MRDKKAVKWTRGCVSVKETGILHYIYCALWEMLKIREALIKSGVRNDAPRFFAGWTKATGNPVGFPRIFGANGEKRPSRTNAKPSGAIYSEVP